MIIKKNSQRFGVVEYTCLSSDITTLFTKYIDSTQNQGSTCEVLDTGVKYVYVIDSNEENYHVTGHWILAPATGSGGGSITPISKCDLVLRSDIDDTIIYKKGVDSISPKVTATLVKGSGDLINLTWSSNPTLSGFDGVDSNMTSLTKTKTLSNLNDTVEITATLSDNNGYSVTKEIKYEFAYPSYLAFKTPEPIDINAVNDTNINTYITTTTEKVISQDTNSIVVTWTGDMERICFCYPASMGVLKGIVQVDVGMNLISGYDHKKVNIVEADGTTVEYYLYISNIESLGTFDFRLEW